MSNELESLNSLLENLMTPFLTWLREKVERSDHDAIVFLSRDGFWFHAACKDGLINKRGNTIPAKYLYVSRASLRKLLQDKRSSVWHEKDVDYLSNVFHNLNSIGVVDLGWSGTSIAILRELFPEKSFYGYFFGNHRLSTRNISSFLGRLRLLKYLGITELLESIFSAPHPSISSARGAESNPKLEYFNSDQYLLELHSQLVLYRSNCANGVSREKPWSVFRLRIELYRLSIYPPSEVFSILGPVAHSTLGDHEEMARLDDHNLDRSGIRAFSLTWPIRRICKDEKINRRALKTISIFLYRQLSVLLRLVYRKLIKPRRRVV